MSTTVHNIRALTGRLPEDAYVGRAGHGEGGYFGNPYSVEEHGAGALCLYVTYLLVRLREDAAFRTAVRGLAGRRLLCFCKPRPCHADFLALAADWLALRGDSDLAGLAAVLVAALDRVLAGGGRGVLRVLTLWRPWDYAISCLGEDSDPKRVENRGRPAPYRCPWYVAVRGGKTWRDVGDGWAPGEEDWPAGLVSCVAEVVAYQAPGEDLDGRWRVPDQWGWVLGRVAPLAEPVRWPPEGARELGDRRSMQGLVALDAEKYPHDAALLGALRRAWRDAFGAGGRFNGLAGG